MAVTYISFIARYPILSTAGQAMIEAEITAAGNHFNAAIWGAKRDDGISYLVAHRIALLLPTEFARLIEADGSTKFLLEFKRMQSELLVGDRVP